MDTVISKEKEKRTLSGRAGEIYKILKGEVLQMFPGSPVTSIKELQNRFSAGQSTVVQAISMLEDEGLLIRKAGKGVFVSEHRQHMVSSSDMKDEYYPEWVNMHKGHVNFFIPQGSEAPMWNHLVNAFNIAGNHIPIVLKQIPGDFTAISDWYNSCDICVFSSPFIMSAPQFHPLDWMDLNPFIKTLRKDEYYRHAFVDDGNGRVWGISPYLVSSMIILDRDRFKSSGTEIPDDSWTWEDLLATSISLKKNSNSFDDIWGFVPMGYMNYFFHNGISFADGSTLKCPINTSAIKEAFDFLKRMIKEEGVAPLWSQIKTHHSWKELLGNRKAGMVETHSGIDVGPNLNFKAGAVSLPLAEGGVRSISMTPVCINSTSLHVDDAWKFVEFVLSEKGQNIISQHTANLPSMKSVFRRDVTAEILKVQQKSAEEGDILYQKCPHIFPVRMIIESAVERWIRYGGDLDKLLAETEALCQRHTEKKKTGQFQNVA